jgi:uncharacterized membrane protein YkoI
MRKLFSVLLVAAVVVSPPSSAADQDAARAARVRGEVLPLASVLAAARRLVAGELLDAELERDDGRWIYELEMLTPDGRVVELEFDAKTGELLEMEDARPRRGKKP